MSMNEQAYYRVSVKALVLDDSGRMLLARESDNTWDMLGGGLDHGENPIACLRREIQEETGLEVVDISAEPKYFLTALKPGANVYVANVLYNITLKNLDFTPSDECQELRFFSIAEMKRLSLLPNIEKLVQILEQ
jgi:8-oxo-dGTP diphosphatase